MMTTVPFTQCCSMLAIDAKTLRQWLKQSDLSLQAHPTDGRIKYLTLEQVQQLATLHGRSITQPVVPTPDTQDVSVLLAQPEATASNLPSTREQESNLIIKLSSLETTVTVLQQQVTQLALALLNERDLRYEHRLSVLEALISPLVGSSLRQQEVPVPTVQECVDEPSPAAWHPNPAEAQVRSRAITLVAYAASGAYVVISPQVGELSFTPDSPEWFDWLASLSSFRFVGQSGRFTAARRSERGRPTRQWTAVRGKHNRTYRCYLGTTSNLTISCLEQAAATLQSRIALL